MTSETHIGAWIPREDGRRKVTGRASYVEDISRPGMLHARLVVCPAAHAEIQGVERTAARQVPGVVGVFVAGDLPLTPDSVLSRVRSPLARDRAYFHGHPVAVVVAESARAAEDAVDLVEITYKSLSAVTDVEEAMRDGSAEIHGTASFETLEESGAHASAGPGTTSLPFPPNAADARRLQRGDIEAGFRAADVVVERSYRTSWLHQSSMEGQACLAEPDGLGGVTVYTSTQSTHITRAEVAAALLIPHHGVKVIPMEVGGAFGAKYALIDPLVSALAMKIGRPVQLVLTRTEEFLAANPVSGMSIRLKTGARRDGTLTALQATVLIDVGAYPDDSARIVATRLAGTYRLPHFQIDTYEVYTNRPGAGAYRAPGTPQACFALEGHIEELARELAIDPLELRLRNAVVEGDLKPDGTPYPRIGGREVLQALRGHPAWRSRHMAPPNEGIGLAFGSWSGSTQAAAATCRLNDDGTLTVVVGSVDLTGTKTGFRLLAADAFGVAPGDVHVVTDADPSAPFAGATGGSKITYTVGEAVRRAALDARGQVLAIAAEELEVSPADLEIAAGGVRPRGVPGRTLPLFEIARVSTSFGAGYEPVLGLGRAAAGASAPGFVAHLVRVRVDPETGLIRVLEYVAVQDVGRAINPAGIHAQIQGGVAQGIGWALHEHMVWDDMGTLQTTTFADYGLPRAEDIPAVHSVLVEVPSLDGPHGARGVGEPPIVPGPAAIANAILLATGVRPSELPIQSARLWEAMQSG